jgi:hypothetical protein
VVPPTPKSQPAGKATQGEWRPAGSPIQEFKLGEHSSEISNFHIRKLSCIGPPERSWRSRVPSKGEVRMEEYSTNTNASGSEFSQTGAAANVNASLDPTVYEV